MTRTATAQDNRRSDTQNGVRSEDLRDSPTMARLLEALEKGADIGHNGQFVFVTAARHFMDEEKIITLLSRQPDMDEHKARAFLYHVAERGYNPPRRERI